MSDIVKEIREEGIEEATNFLFQLSEYLIENNRYDDWKRAAKDKDFRAKLIAEMLEHESISI